MMRMWATLGVIAAFFLGQDARAQCTSHVDCPSYTFCFAHQCVRQSTPTPDPRSETTPARVDSTDAREPPDTGWAYAAGIYGLAAYTAVLGLGVSSEATRTEQVPGLPLGSAATAIHLASVPILSEGGASARDSAGVKGIPALRLASWILYGLSALGAVSLVGIGISNESPPDGVVASVTGVMCLSGALMTIDAFSSDSQANRKLARTRSPGKKNQKNRWTPLVAGTRNLFQVGIAASF